MSSRISTPARMGNQSTTYAGHLADQGDDEPYQCGAKNNALPCHVPPNCI